MPKLKARLKSTQNRISSDNPYNAPIGNHWYLADFFALHPLENTQRRVVRRYGGNSVKRLHHRLDRSITPFLARS
jgi:hypothetical protein